MQILNILLSNQPAKLIYYREILLYIYIIRVLSAVPDQQYYYISWFNAVKDLHISFYQNKRLFYLCLFPPNTDVYREV
jgi:hypothetical protein